MDYQLSLSTLIKVVGNSFGFALNKFNDPQKINDLSISLSACMKPGSAVWLNLNIKGRTATGSAQTLRKV